MGFKCGIVGLPNVGKSTLFNALTKTAAAQAANYPFCTIEPNVGEVAVPEPRLTTLAQIAGSKEIIPARMNFVDIAGLVRGASKGEGLGNQFLGNIRECDAVTYVTRCFVDDDITHVEGRIDPLADLETVETELMLADLESLEKRIPNLEKKAKQSDKDAKLTLELCLEAKKLLDEGKPARLLRPMPRRTTPPLWLFARKWKQSLRPSMMRKPKNIWKPQALMNPASTSLFAVAIASWACKPISPSAQKKRALGPFTKAGPPLSQPALFMAILKKALSAQKPSIMRIMSRSKAKTGPRKREKCAWKVRNISSKTAT